MRRSIASIVASLMSATSASLSQRMTNDDASGDLTSGWKATKFVITGQTQHSVGCPSIRHGEDGYYCEHLPRPSVRTWLRCLRVLQTP